MKKILAILLVLGLVASSAFATVLQVGATGRFGGDITSLDSYKEVSNYDFGADARLNLGAFGLAANVLFGKNGENRVYNTILTANVRLDLQAVDFALGAGYSLPVEVSTSGDVLIDNQPIEKTLDVLKNSQLLARAAVGVNIGGLCLSVDYKIPFSTIIDYLKRNDMKNLESFKQGKVALSVLVNIF